MYVWFAFTVYAAFRLVSWETTVGFGFHKPSLPWRDQSSLKPSTFSEGEDIEIYLVQFSAQKSLGAAAQTWRLERKKSCNIFFFASSLRLFSSFRGIWYMRFSEMGFVFGLPEFYGTIWTEKTVDPSLYWFHFSMFGLDLHFSEEMSISCSFLWWCTWVRPHPCTLAPFELSPLWAFWTLISNMGAVHHDLFG